MGAKLFAASTDLAWGKNGRTTAATTFAPMIILRHPSPAGGRTPFAMEMIIRPGAGDASSAPQTSS